MATSFESSAVYLRGLVRALEKTGHFAQVQAKGGPAVAALMAAPSSQPWWPQAAMVPFFEAVEAVGGAALMAQMGRVAVQDTIAAVVQPLVRVVSAFGLVTPDTFFARMGQFSLTAIRHVDFAWAGGGPRQGVLTITYPGAVPACLAPLWLGPLEHVYEVAGCAFEPTSIHVAGNRFTFTLTWK